MKNNISPEIIFLYEVNKKENKVLKNNYYKKYIKNLLLND